MKTHGHVLDSWTYAKAALKGNLDVIKRARNIQIDWDAQIYQYAAWGNHSEIIKYAKDSSHLGNNCPLDEYFYSRMCKEIAMRGNFELLKWCIDKTNFPGYIHDRRTCKKAFEYKHYEISKWFTESDNCLCGGEYHETDKK